jgi:hypothetical protein
LVLFQPNFALFFYGWKSEHDELEAKFKEERAALEAKYQKLYEPLYSKVLTSGLNEDYCKPL